MCGRIDIHRIPWTFFHVKEPDAPMDGGYNVAPTAIVPMIYLGENGERRVTGAARSLHRSWVSEPPKRPLFNARPETVHSLPSFRDAFRIRRCIVPACGYFEWRRDDRQPFYFSRKDGCPLAFAGIYKEGGDGTLSTCTLTTQPNRDCAPIHDRMPVILGRKFWDRWLTPRELTQSDSLAILVLAPEGLLQSWPVDRAVGNVRNEGAGLVESGGVSFSEASVSPYMGVECVLDRIWGG